MFIQVSRKRLSLSEKKFGVYRDFFRNQRVLQQGLHIQLVHHGETRQMNV